MKKLVSLVLVLTFAFALTACSGKDMGRISYNLDMEDYVELCKYKGIEVNTKSEEYQSIYSQFKQSDIQNNNLYARITEGKLKKGDVANINYVGKLNGEAFQGGSADGYNLELGSNTFIPGFEDGLIGAEIGSTVDLNVTFPKDYQSTELAGKAVVFTVKVNYVTVYDKITEGILKNGDAVNIDVVGKVDGKEFEGGSFNNFKLVLGSGQFIDGFESGLIGKKIGDTVDLNLKFPTNYTAELAGKNVVFTVKINYTTAIRELTPEEYYSELGHKTVEEYYESLKKRTLENILVTKVLEGSKIEEYPEDEMEIAIEKGKKSIENYLKQNYGTSVTLEQYLTANQLTDEDFEEQVTENFAKPLMKEEMIFYAIFDKAGLIIDKDELVKKTKEVVASFKSDKVTEKTLKEENGDNFFETLYIQEKVVEYLIKNAKVS